jgi:hypothetical protein
VLVRWRFKLKDKLWVLIRAQVEEGADSIGLSPTQGVCSGSSARIGKFLPRKQFDDLHHVQPFACFPRGADGEAQSPLQLVNNNHLFKVPE